MPLSRGKVATRGDVNYVKVKNIMVEEKPKRQLTESARCAKAIRTELKANYPQTKFTVHSSNFANGDSVHVEWMDGPAIKDVQTILRKYEYGEFDGMTDSYKCTNLRKDIPQAKYVQTKRAYSDSAKLIIANLINLEWSNRNLAGYERDCLANRLLNEHTFPPFLTQTNKPKAPKSPTKILIVE